MQRKKTDKVNLENQKGIFFLIGFVIALGIVFLAFEWSISDEDTDMDTVLIDVDFEVEMLLPPENNKKPEQPKPAPEKHQVIKIVDNDKPVDNDARLWDVEVDENTAISLPEFEEEPTIDIPYFLIKEEKPVFPGGEKGLKTFITTNLIYPQQARKEKIQGRVYVKFLINKNGKVEQTKILQKIHPALDKEALRVVKKMPCWQPGRQNGKAVGVWYTIPITFKLY